jgi:hypothetical protein
MPISAEDGRIDFRTEPKIVGGYDDVFHGGNGLRYLQKMVPWSIPGPLHSISTSSPFFRKNRFPRT